jgi:DNA-binding SARP family transcriptional activator
VGHAICLLRSETDGVDACQLFDALGVIDDPESMAQIFDQAEVSARAGAWLALCAGGVHVAERHGWFIYHCARLVAGSDRDRSLRHLHDVAHAFALRGESSSEALVRCAILEVERSTGTAPVRPRGADGAAIAWMLETVLAPPPGETASMKFRLGAAILDCGIAAGDDAELSLVSRLDAHLDDAPATLAVLDWYAASAEWHVRRLGDIATAEEWVRKGLKLAATLDSRLGRARMLGLDATLRMARGESIGASIAGAPHATRLDDLRRAQLVALKQAMSCATRRQAAGQPAQSHDALLEPGLGGSVLWASEYRIAAASICAEAGMTALAQSWLDEVSPATSSTGSDGVADARLLLRAWELAQNGYEAEAAEIVRRPLTRQAAHGHSALFPYAPTVAAKLVELGLRAGACPAWLHQVIARQALRAPDDTSPVWPWHVRANLLGTPSIHLGGEPMRDTGKAQQRVWELLCVLAAAGAAGKSQSFVMRQLWAESDSPATALRVAIHRLRKMLGCDEAVVVKNGSVALNCELVWTDLQALLVSCERAIHLREGCTAQDLRLKADRLLQLYRGGILCAESLPWASAMQEKVSAQFVAATCSIAERLERQADWSGASRIYRRTLDPEPFNEAAYRGLMRCAVAVGDMAAAFSHYRFCRDTVPVAVGRKPSPETYRLAERLGLVSRAELAPDIATGAHTVALP